MRKPRDIDGELRALQERARELRTKKTVQFGELVAATGADALPVEALAGVLLAAAEQAKEKPEAVARWTERGQAFFRASAEARKRGGRGKEARDGAGAGTSGPGSAATQVSGDGG